jgi:type IV fimbrial biogenesis protein FimT
MRTNHHGFTLLELMTALAVLGVLVALAAPSFKQFSANSRIAATANSLANALAVARTEALRQSMPVAICASSDAQTCKLGNRNDWSTGWIVFTDNSGTTGVLDSTDTLIQTWPAPGGNVSVNSTSNYLEFNARGMSALGAATTLTAWVPGCTGNNQSQIVVTVAGSPQSSKIACP